MPLDGDAIAELCYRRYDSLPMGSKPRPNEWTVLSCFVRFSRGDRMEEVVSLGTGSKCLGRGEMDDEGRALNDSHAEVVARRGLLRYLYDQIERAIVGEEAVCRTDPRVPGKFVLAEGTRFVMFSTRPPCGDASVVYDAEDPARLEANTGARPVGADDHVEDKLRPSLARVRRKPGRGDRTASVSCSDKLARWARVGVQGALLDALLDRPLPIDAIVVAGDFCEASLRRAVADRGDNPVPFSIIGTSLPFSDAEREGRDRPSDSSLAWCLTKEAPFEVSVGGRKKGATRKAFKKDSVSPRISKRLLFARFLGVLDAARERSVPCEASSLLGDDPNTYGEVKRNCKSYRQRWEKIRKETFDAWSDKPDLLNFTLRPKVTEKQS